MTFAIHCCFQICNEKMLCLKQVNIASNEKMQQRIASDFTDFERLDFPIIAGRDPCHVKESCSLAREPFRFCYQVWMQVQPDLLQHPGPHPPVEYQNRTNWNLKTASV